MPGTQNEDKVYSLTNENKRLENVVINGSLPPIGRPSRHVILGFNQETVYRTKVQQMPVAELLMIPLISAIFSGSNEPIVLTREWTELRQIWAGHRAIIVDASEVL